MRIEQRPPNRLRAALYGAGALLLALLMGLTAAAQGHAAAGWQPVPPPAASGLSAYVPFDATSAVARSTVQTSTTCLPCEYEHTLWTRQAGAWSALPPPPAGASTDVLTGTAPNDVWALGRGERDFGQYHWDGSRWTDRTVPDFEVLAARAVSRTDAWAVGNYRESDGTCPARSPLERLGLDADQARRARRLDQHQGRARRVRPRRLAGGRPAAASTPRTTTACPGRRWPSPACLVSATANAVTVRNGEVWIGGTDRNIYTDSGTPRAFVLHGNGTDWQTTYVPVPAPTGYVSEDRMSVQALAVHDGTVWAGQACSAGYGRPRPAARRVLGHGQRGAVQLAVGGQGVRRGRRTRPAPCGRAAARQDARAAARSRGPPASGHHVSDQPAVPRPVLPHHDGGLRHRGVCGERRLDLTGFDAEAADLDLRVGPAQVDQHPVGGEPGEVALYGTCGRRPHRGGRRRTVRRYGRPGPDSRGRACPR
ncbi:hypothetical protein SVIOM342S_10059 [Streptomyces violaceorubidus]